MAFLFLPSFSLAVFNTRYFFSNLNFAKTACFESLPKLPNRKTTLFRMSSMLFDLRSASSFRPATNISSSRRIGEVSFWSFLVLMVGFEEEIALRALGLDCFEAVIASFLMLYDTFGPFISMKVFFTVRSLLIFAAEAVGIGFFSSFLLWLGVT